MKVRHIDHTGINVEALDDIIAMIKQKGFGLVSDVQNYEDQRKLCYVRGPEGIIIELAERLS